MEKVPARPLGMAAFLGGNTLLEKRRKAHLPLETECAAKRLRSSQVPKMSRTKTDAEFARAKRRKEVLRNRRPRPAVPEAAPVVEEPVAAVVSSAVGAPSSINPARRKTTAAKCREEGVRQRRLQRQAKDRAVARRVEEDRMVAQEMEDVEEIKVGGRGMKRASSGLESASKRMCCPPHTGADKDPFFGIWPKNPQAEIQAQAPVDNKHDEAWEVGVETSEVEASKADLKPAEVETSEVDVKPVEVETTEADVKPVEVETTEADVKPVEVATSEVDVKTAEEKTSEVDVETSELNVDTSEVEVDTSDLDVKTIRGLVNIQDACYSNAALQLLDAALSPVQVKALRGSTSIDPLATRHDALLQHSRERALDPKKRRGYQTFRKAVQEMWEEDEGVQISPYLGDLLSNLRKGITEVSELKEEDTYVTPLFFQHLFAVSNDPKKTPYDGLSQQDSAEYLESVLESVIMEGTVSADSFATHFEVKQTCVNGCEHSRRCADQLHRVLRTTLTEKRTDLTKLVSKALEIEEDYTHLTCKNCKRSGTLWQHEKATSLPENLVISIDRSLCLRAKVDIPYGEVIKLQEHRYRVKAVVCHKGQSRNSGHYCAVREHNGDYYILDDSTVSLVRSMSSLQDGCRVGNSCTVLLQKVDTTNQGS